MHHPGARGQEEGELAPDGPPLAVPARGGQRRLRVHRRGEGELVGRRAPPGRLEEAPDPARQDELGARPDRGSHHFLARQADEQDIVHAGDPGNLGDPETVALGQVLHHGGEERWREVEGVERELVERRAAPVLAARVGNA